MSINIQTIADIRKFISGELSQLYPPPEISSLTSLIIKAILKPGKSYSFPDQNEKVAADDAEKIMSITARLKSGMPLQYILGETEFYGYTIRVNPSVLIPRQETEELVDLVVKENTGFSGRILDMGTGSGCIAIAIAGSLPEAAVSALDNSPRALETARISSLLNGVKVRFIEADIFTLENPDNEPFDILVSNPPYVKESEKLQMHMNVTGHEPHGALFVPDDDPLRYYRKMLDLCHSLVRPGGLVYFEINESQGGGIMKLAEAFQLAGTRIIKDLNGKDRIFKGTYYGRK